MISMDFGRSGPKEEDVTKRAKYVMTRDILKPALLTFEGFRTDSP